MQKELLIFGAAGALGKGITKVMMSKDYDKIYLLDFKPDSNKYPANIEFIQYDDLSLEENVEKIFSQINPGENKNFFLYSTVGGYLGGIKIWETKPEELEQQLNMNLKTSFFIAKHFALLVKKSNAGSILFTAAYTALVPEKQKAAYGASKRGVIGLVETLAIEGVEINLSANAIAPYVIDTPANREWGTQEDILTWIKPEEIGELAHLVFMNFEILSGNVLKLKIRLKGRNLTLAN